MIPALVEGRLGLVLAAASGVVAGLALERRLVTRRIAARSAGESRADGGAPFFSLRAPGPDVRTPDGVLLHTEVDEVGERSEDDLTLVFVHGYALSLDCWHFQRQHVRGRFRSVYYDQRSHGRSTRSDAAHSRIPQLGEDLLQVLDEVAGPGPLVLVGHSMGGMTIMHLAQAHPDLFGSRILGVVLYSTAAGEMADYSLVPVLPGRVFSQVALTLLTVLNRMPELVATRRRTGSDLSYAATRWLAFGSDVPVEYVEFVSDMLAGTALEVLADFYPGFAELDEYEALAVLNQVETAVVGGDDDRITPVDHTEKIIQLLPAADTRRLASCGHLGMIEHHDVFNSVLDQLVERVRALRPGTATV